jgi:hypothetical protein
MQSSRSRPKPTKISTRSPRRKNRWPDLTVFPADVTVHHDSSKRAPPRALHPLPDPASQHRRAIAVDHASSGKWLGWEDPQPRPNNALIRLIYSVSVPPQCTTANARISGVPVGDRTSPARTELSPSSSFQLSNVEGLVHTNCRPYGQCLLSLVAKNQSGSRGGRSSVSPPETRSHQSVLRDGSVGS